MQQFLELHMDISLGFSVILKNRTFHFTSKKGQWLSKFPGEPFFRPAFFEKHSFFRGVFPGKRRFRLDRMFAKKAARQRASKGRTSPPNIFFKKSKPPMSRGMIDGGLQQGPNPGGGRRPLRGGKGENG
ncbi:MAG: hypothetical protein C6W57_15620 [Caldibacillus debilis]|nr:MAG: hypothetical protein C6W57_15620 [Caldibacillus debilis]